MNGESYEDIVQLEGDAYDDSEDYGGEDVDDVLDSLIESNGADFSERRRGGKRGRNGKRGAAPARGVQTGSGQNAYRAPANEGGTVTQKQLKDALARVGVDVRRNAEGIKTINTRLQTIGSRVDSVVAISDAHNKKIMRFDKQMQLDGTFEFVESLTPTGVNLYQILKGAAKSGMLGDGTGALANPFVLGGLGLVLNNPALLSGLIPNKT